MEITFDDRTEYRLIVAGGRDFSDYDLFISELAKLANNELADHAISLVSGMAPGADRMAYDFALRNGIACTPFPPQWDRYGKSAGYRRNVEMANHAQGLLAFHDSVSRGTQHMIDIATEKGLSVRVVNY